MPELEMERPVDQHPHRAIRLIAARRDLFSRQGAVVATWRSRSRPDRLAGSVTHTGKCGPYYRLAYREDGRQRSVYLGREGPVVDEVRRLLADLQRPLQQRRLMNRLFRQARAAVRIHKTRVDAQLRPLGLRLQGFEVRGWQTSLLRGLRPTPPTIRPLRGLRPPQFKVSRLRPIRTPRIPRCGPERPTPAVTSPPRRGKT